MQMLRVDDARIVVVATLKFTPDNASRAIEKLQTAIESFRKHDGCIAYDLSRDCSDPGLLRAAEIWLNSDCLYRHAAHADVGRWNGYLSDCEVIEETYMVCDISGIKIIKKP
jgi:quinol monooxygenase YgiN